MTLLSLVLEAKETAIRQWCSTYGLRSSPRVWEFGNREVVAALRAAAPAATVPPGAKYLDPWGPPRHWMIWIAPMDCPCAGSAPQTDHMRGIQPMNWPRAIHPAHQRITKSHRKVGLDKTG